jgi:hypothetical protein
MRKPHIENVHFWKYNEDQLKFTIQDCHEAIEAYPNNPKCIHGKGNYADQIHDAHTVLRFKKMKREKILTDILKERTSK